VEERLRPILRRAREIGAFVCVDMEQFEFRDLTRRIFASVATSDEFRDWDGIGIVVQTYLKDAEEELTRIRRVAEDREAPITVRLVKGAYWDEETVVAQQENREVPVFLAKSATDANFERCTEALLAAYPLLRPAFASHNARSISQAIVKAEAMLPTKDDVEFQFLYGMAEQLREATAAEGFLTRVYVPIGEIIPGMAYLVRRLLENTSNESWLLHRHEGQEPALALGRPDPEDGKMEVGAGFRNQTLLELHDPAVRGRMTDALRDVRAAFGREYPVLISGRPVETEATEDVHPPAHPELLMGRTGRARPEDVDRAVLAATSALPAWRDRGGRGRAEVLRRAAALYRERREELAATMVYESAKPWREADGDVCEAIDFLEYYAAQAEELGDGLDLSSVPGEENRLVYEGRGVAGVIAPWNFPLAILTGMATGALAAGCPVLLKPAGQSPLVAARMVEIMHEAGVPGDILHYLPGSGSMTGRAVVDHPGIDMIAFTGSKAVGLQIVEESARPHPGRANIRRVIAELGGKNAIIVDDDADLDQAVSGVVQSAFGYAGQKCSACSRVVAVGSAYGEFRDRLAAAVESLVIGPPEDPYTFVPPVISAGAKERIGEYIAIGRAEGRLVARSLADLPDEGHYVPPHVFEAVPRTSRLVREEVFGPILVLFWAATFGEALEVALDSEFALTGGVYSRNPRSIARARGSFRVGNLYVNRKTTGAIVGRQPFGGFHMSGTDDKAGGPDYVKQFMLARVVTEDTMRRGFVPYRAS
ncbi:MAG: bifunctional proline dehydrogenase/L-glutamate gamma-semialdehyde dehydrogenase, partial [Dehalococcoidia bacterium]